MLLSMGPEDGKLPLRLDSPFIFVIIDRGCTAFGDLDRDETPNRYFEVFYS